MNKKTSIFLAGPNPTHYKMKNSDQNPTHFNPTHGLIQPMSISDAYGCPKWHLCRRAVLTDPEHGREHRQCVPTLIYNVSLHRSSPLSVILSVAATFDN